MPAGDKSEIFINCPFDDDYAPLFDAMVFVVCRCGFRPRCVKELDDGSQNRLEKIEDIIGECLFGIHDISQTALDAKTNLPRFNMPLELGLFLGAKKWGRADNRHKKCLVFDREEFRYQKFLSDLAGQDITPHKGEPRILVIETRNWLLSASPGLPGGSAIWDEYKTFKSNLPAMCSEMKLVESELIFNDYTRLVDEWLERQQQLSQAPSAESH